jgi:hypothetical protein
VPDRPTRNEECIFEVTPEMIEAGREALYKFDIMHPTEEEMREAVRAVFVSMLQAQP